MSNQDRWKWAIVIKLVGSGQELTFDGGANVSVAAGDDLLPHVIEAIKPKIPKGVGFTIVNFYPTPVR
ncbi:hypothetical protein AB0G60_02710 [Streptomyces angustmyceticus]|uniref:Uncharacterized protein n=1 Tax=Streptomyces angustmyceticus TaxID=285578 RepID=A0A5J4L9C2_9ACTN|nr:hypothetical protein [Streptomyces angustmyceticus]UAL65575.1 hypothetical protein K7396_02685 [Streptomyces angustmyceticus]GES27906.1 hypothetical protein San01_03930 [Streptomyces angustmyceticus]